MERTHRPGACELVATDECTVLQLVFATRVGNSWLDACDPLAAECKVLRWGTGMGGNGRDGCYSIGAFFLVDQESGFHCCCRHQSGGFPTALTWLTIR